MIARVHPFASEFAEPKKDQIESLFDYYPRCLLHKHRVMAESTSLCLRLNLPSPKSPVKASKISQDQDRSKIELGPCAIGFEDSAAAWKLDYASYVDLTSFVHDSGS